MVTIVNMKRELFGGYISQNSKTKFFSATELNKVGNKWRQKNNLSPFNMTQYLNSVGTKDFMTELENKYGPCIVKGRGRNSNTWVHPLLFIDIALAISPKLKIEVYEWLFDNLIKYRNDSGDSYKEMSAALYERSTNTRDFKNYISKVANYIKESIGVEDWQLATETQLQQRDNIHKTIKLLSKVMKNPNAIVRLAVKEVLS